jgi:WD40 repeat protein
MNRPLARLRFGRRSAVVTAAALVVGAVVAVWWWERRPPLPVRARLARRGLRLSPLAFSRDGRLLVTRDLQVGDGFVLYWGVSLWDLPGGSVRAEVKTGLAPREAIFSPDGRRLVVVCQSVGRSTPVLVIDAGTGALLKRFEVDRPRLLNLEFSADGSALRAIAWDAGLRPPPTVAWEVRSWDATTWAEQPRRPLALPAHELVAFSADGRSAATEDFGKPSLTFWDLSTGASLGPAAASKSMPRVLEFLSDGETLAVGRFDGSIELWDRATRRRGAALRVPTPGYSPYELRAVPGSSALVGEAYERPRPTTLPRPVRDVMSVLGFGRCVQIVRGEVVVWDLGSRRVRAALRGEVSPVVSSDGRTLATGGEGGVTLWDLAPGGGSSEAAGPRP